MTAPTSLPAPLAAQLQALLDPPSTPRPVASDDRSRALRGEIDKLGSLDGEAPNWSAVADLGAAILRESGKDLLTAAYTGLALSKLHGPAGIAVAVVAFTHLLRVPELSPARPKNRAVALGWYIDHLRRELSELKPEPEHASILRGLPAQIRELRTAADDVLGEHTPSLSPLLKLLEPILLELPAEPEAEPAREDEAHIEAVPSDMHHGSSAADERTTSLSRDASSPEGDTAPPAASTAPEGATAMSADPDAPPDPLAELRETAAPWLAPLSPEAPCGVDPSANESFAELRAEIQKLSAITGSDVNWQFVDTRSDHLLRTLSKDLRLASYLTLARHRRAGLPGLALGLLLTADLLDRYPSALYPLQAHGRGKFAAWLIDQAAAALRAPSAPLSQATHAVLKAAASHLSAVLQDRLEDRAPSTRPLRDAIAALPIEVEPEPEHELIDEEGAEPGDKSTDDHDDAGAVDDQGSTNDRDTNSTGTSPRQTTTTLTDSSTNDTIAPTVHVQAAKSVTPSADLSQLDRFLDETDDALAQTARALREAIPSDPRAYRLLRIGLWLKLTAPPAAKPDGTTGVLPLPDRDREALLELAEKGLWPALLQRSENLLSRHRYLLDLQRLSHAALCGLGQEYEAAAVAVRAEVAGLVLRFPGLVLLKDRDGNPLADPETQTWLDEQIPTGSGTASKSAIVSPAAPPSPAIQRPSPGAPPSPAPTDPFWQDLPARLRSAPHPTLLEAQVHLDRSPTGHQRFASALTLAEALLEAGDHQRAAYLFAGLAAEADRHHLDRWDPPLLIRCLQGTAKAHNLTNNPQARDTALQRLTPLAPTFEALA